MEMVVGHMEYVTSSELSFQFTREISALARQKVDAMEKGLSTALIAPVTTCHLPIDMDGNPFDNVSF